MCVDLVPLRGWPLFAPDRRFALGWSELRPDPLHPDADEFYAVGPTSAELARVHLDLRPMDLSPWPDAPAAAPMVRVQLVEVAAGERGRGLGRAIMRRVAARHAGARLVAVALPESAGFWAALGWRRFEHRAEGGRLPLYVAPPWQRRHEGLARRARPSARLDPHTAAAMTAAAANPFARCLLLVGGSTGHVLGGFDDHFGDAAPGQGRFQFSLHRIEAGGRTELGGGFGGGSTGQTGGHSGLLREIVRLVSLR
jgi:GNAT superfamily N-acetyltransferase